MEEEEQEESLGEIRERFKASTKGEASCREEEAGPKMRRSLSVEGVRGREISSCSGSGARTGGGRGFFLGLRYGSRGSFSIWGGDHQDYDLWSRGEARNQDGGF